MVDLMDALMFYSYILACFALLFLALGIHTHWYEKDRCPQCYTTYDDGWHKRTSSNICSECLQWNAVVRHKKD